MNAATLNAIAKDCRSNQINRKNARFYEGWKGELDRYTGAYTLKNHKTGEVYVGTIARLKNGELGSRITWNI